MNAKELASDVIWSGNPPLWRTTFTVYTDNSHEQAVKVKDEILRALNEYTTLQDENADLLRRIVQRDEENYQLKQLKERLDILIANSNPIVDVFTVSVLEKLRDGEQNGN